MKHLIALLLPFLLLASCGESDNHNAGGLHIHTAPHGGSLVEVGGHIANVEFLLDSPNGKLTAYILDAHADQAVRVKQKTLDIHIEGQGVTPELNLSLAGVASSLTGEILGDTSQFEVADLGLKGRTLLKGYIKQLEFRGQNFTSIEFNIVGK